MTDNGISSFKGIPFAAPPVGELRWAPPKPHEGWDGTLDASDFGNVCPQNLKPGYSLEVLGDRPMSEDCLQLNVWTGAPDPEAKRPVMVWILPGGFSVGDTAMPRYDATALAEQGVVVVTFNYRLGMLGQFAHPALRASQPDEPAGNYHMMDQVAALEWVRDNIASFGGDPGNVTIFGMSAGGVSVNYHMAMPSSAGLFHRAISESSGIRVGNPRHISLDSLTLLGDKIGDFGNRPNETDERYSGMVSAYWVQFAKTGNPNGNGLPGWPATTPANDLLLEFGQTGVTIHRDFREARRAFWEQHFDSGGL